MPRIAGVLLVAALVTIFTPTGAHPGHELPYYPSYYPQEIRIESIDPGFAVALLQKGSIQAYIGSDLFSGVQIPANVASAESLGAYLVVTFNPASDQLGDRERRCRAASGILTTLAARNEEYRFHPYPVTPYHMDYLQHADMLESAKRPFHDRVAGTSSASNASLRVRAKGRIAETLLPSGGRAANTAWDVTVEEIDVADLMAGAVSGMNGWMGPPWVKEGWFHAHRLLAEHLTDTAVKQTADAIYQRLVNGDDKSVIERLNLERRLVSLLTQGCERVVLGYTMKHEYYSEEYSAGVENIAYDAHAGFLSPIFLRTVKLKDFPWNGWLRLGMNAKPEAAWNPIAGFTDALGKLMWFAVGDLAFLPAPHNSTWIANRISPDITIEGSSSGGVAIPKDALIPEAGTGLFREVGDGRTAQVKLTYRVLSSAFHDGTQTIVPDLLYPYAVAFRWGTRKSSEDAEYDPHIDAATAFMRAKLAGIRVVSVEQQSKVFGELKLMQEVPVIEIYLNDTSSDFPYAAAIAPPWSTVPWPVIVLMQEGVKQGFAAFSKEAANSRGIAWLDLVRDQKLKNQLAALVAEFEVQGYRPDALKGFVTETEARQRWSALKSFYLARGHFLVTNGPYRLDQWQDHAVVLQVFRDLSYPLGVGSYDKYAFPSRALLSKVEVRRHRLEISAEMQKVEKAQRAYHVVRERLTDHSMVGVYGVRPLVRYIVLSADGEVLQAGHGHYAGDGIFAVELQGKLQPGRYTVLTTIYLNDNYVDPDVKLIPYQIEE